MPDPKLPPGPSWDDLVTMHAHDRGISRKEAAEILKKAMFGDHPPLRVVWPPEATPVSECPESTGHVPVEQLRAMIRLLWPAEITPTAQRMLLSLCVGEPDLTGELL